MSEKKDNVPNEEEKIHIEVPPITLDLLIAVHNCFTIAMNKKIYEGEKEIKFANTVYQHFSLSMEGMINEYNKNFLENNNQQEGNESEKIPDKKHCELPKNIKNGCDANEGDIQG